MQRDQALGVPLARGAQLNADVRQERKFQCPELVEFVRRAELVFGGREALRVVAAFVEFGLDKDGGAVVLDAFDVALERLSARDFDLGIELHNCAFRYALT